jgi:hypothetical protein
VGHRVRERAVSGAGLFEALRVRGFEPDSNGWLTFTVADGALFVPHGRVRVVLDDNVTVIYVLTGNGVLLWDVRISEGTPLSVVTGVIDQAIGHVMIARAVASR